MIGKKIGAGKFAILRKCIDTSADPEGRGDRGSVPPPPGKSQDIWVSIGNKQLDPPPPGKSWTPLEKP